MSRCVVTGCGVLSAIGDDCASTLDSLRRGYGGIAPFTIAGRDHQPIRTAATLRDYDDSRHFTKTELGLYDPCVQYALIAAREAVADAKIAFKPGNSRVAIVFGTGIGGKTSDDMASERLYTGDGRVSPMAILRIMMSSVSSHLSIAFGIVGPTLTTTTASASSAHAIGIATGMIRRGEVDVAIAGGTEAPLCYGLLCAWESMRILDPQTCRPFSKSRRGLVLGEGAGAVVLESLEHAERRGAMPYGEIAGVGFSADAHHLTAPSLEGPATAIRAALHDAAATPSDIDYINAHGTGTPINDAMETRVIRTVFGEHADRLFVSSTKSAHGHCLGGSAAIELICTLLGMRHDFTPATLNYDTPDPECDLNYVPNQPIAHTPQFALNNAFAFGGLNVCLAVRKLQ